MSEPITMDRVFELLLEAFPEAREEWDEHLAEWSDENDPVPYIKAMIFSRHIVEAFEKGETSVLPKGFELIERLVAEGDQDVQGIAVVGILEGIQISSSWQPFGPDVVVKWLGPKSKEAWDPLNIVWEGKQNLADVIRSPGGTK